MEKSKRLGLCLSAPSDHHASIVRFSLPDHLDDVTVLSIQWIFFFSPDHSGDIHRVVSWKKRTPIEPGGRWELQFDRSAGCQPRIGNLAIENRDDDGLVDGRIVEVFLKEASDKGELVTGEPSIDPVTRITLAQAKTAIANQYGISDKQVSITISA